MGKQIKLSGTASGRCLVEALDSRRLLAVTLVAAAEGNRFTPIEFDGRIYYGGRDAAHGSELWSTDGSADGARMLADLTPGSAGSFFSTATVFRDSLYFTTAATEGKTTTLWRTDGTSAGTVKLTDALPGSVWGYEPVGEVLYLATYGGASNLWRTDGTAAGTGRAVPTALAQSTVYSMLPYRKRLVLTTVGKVNGHYVASIVRTDGTEAGTETVGEIPTNLDRQPPGLMPANGQLYFLGPWGGLWRTQGTRTTTNEITLPPFDRSGIPMEPIAIHGVGGRLMIDEQHGLWSLGSSADDIKLLSSQSYDSLDDWRYREIADGQLYFAQPEFPGRIWRTDGDPESIARVVTHDGQASLQYMGSASGTTYYVGWAEELADPVVYGTTRNTRAGVALATGMPDSNIIPLNGRAVYLASGIGGVTTGRALVEIEPAKASVAGKVFNDADRNGAYSPTQTADPNEGEPVFPGLVVWADLNGNDRLDRSEPSATSDKHGQFRIDGLKAVPTSFRVEAPAGYALTTDPSPIPLSPEAQNSITLGVGTTAATASLAGIVYQDANYNGTQEADEEGMPKVRVFIDGNLDGVYQSGELTTQTDANGRFVFNRLKGGYKRIATDAGTWQTVVKQVVAVPGTTRELILAARDSKVVQGAVYNDLNGDGVRQKNEPGIGGVELFFTSSWDGFHDWTATTQADGRYQILVPPNHHSLSVSVGAVGWRVTARPDVLLLTEPQTNADFGLTQLAMVRGIVFDDAGGDGDFRESAGRIGGLRAYLDLDGDGQLDADEPNMLTNRGGWYQFPVTPNRRYRIRLNLPDTSRMFTTASTFLVRPRSGQTVSSHIGLTAPQTVEGTVWRDDQMNNAQEFDEPPVEGFRLFMDYDNDHVRDSNEPWAITGADGAFTIQRVLPGTRLIRAFPGQGLRVSSSREAWSTHEPELPLVASARVVGRIFYDHNHDGIEDPSETSWDAYAGGRVEYYRAGEKQPAGFESFNTNTEARRLIDLDIIGTGSIRVRLVLDGPERVTMPAVRYVDLDVSAGQTVTGVVFGIG